MNKKKGRDIKNILRNNQQFFSKFNEDDIPTDPRSSVNIKHKKQRHLHWGISYSNYLKPMTKRKLKSRQREKTTYSQQIMISMTVNFLLETM